MKILITGASGKLGKHLTTFLLADNHELVLISRSQTQIEGRLAHRADISSPDDIAQIFKTEKPQAVIHLASIIGVDCEENPKLAEKVNVEATKSLINLANEFGVEKFIFASTSAVYGRHELAATDENHNINPTSVYGRTKLSAEKMLSSYAEKSSTQVIVFRLFNIYGEGFTDSLIYKLVHSTEDKPVGLRSLDNFYRDYVHVDDVLGAFAAALERLGDTKLATLNIGSGKALSNRELLDNLKDLGIEPHYTVSTGQLDVSWADISKARKLLNFEPRTVIDPRYI